MYEIVGASLEIETKDDYIAGYAPEESDRAVEEMNKALEAMTIGIEDSLQEAIQDDSRAKPIIETRPKYYSSLDGPHGSVTRFLVFSGLSQYDGVQPGFIDDYHVARTRAFRTLQAAAVTNGEVKRMLTAMEETPDPHMAQRFLAILGRDKQRYPDWTNASGTARIHRRIDDKNKETTELNRAVNSYAAEQRSEEYGTDNTVVTKFRQLRKLGSLGLKKYVAAELIPPIQDAAWRPMIEKQLLGDAVAKAGAEYQWFHQRG